MERICVKTQAYRIEEPVRASLGVLSFVPTANIKSVRFIVHDLFEKALSADIRTPPTDSGGFLDGRVPNSGALAPEKQP